MTTLVLKLAGPMQSWGTDSRFAFRHTRTHPSKSGVIGLLAAALGRRRSDPLEDLLELRFGVRHDQPGRILRDFQTAASLDRSRILPLTQRYYLSDAAFVAAIEGPDDVVANLADALTHPKFPLYLGRRSCPPASPVFLSTLPGSMLDALAGPDCSPWIAARWWRQRQPRRVRLDITRDANPDEPTHEMVRDLPVSFDSDHRQYSVRAVVHDHCWVTNDRSATIHSSRTRTDHDPCQMWGEN